MTGLTPSTLTRRYPALWRALGLSLTLLAITHVLVWLLGIWSVEIINNSQTGSLWQSFAMWNRWDTPHYLDLARHGYSNHGELGLFIVFFPAYPALIRVLTLLTGDAYMSALLISLFGCVSSTAMAKFLLRGEVIE